MIRRLTSALLLAATLLSLAAPAFAACRCGDDCSMHAQRAAAKHCGRCPSATGTGARLAGESCCAERAVSVTPAISPARVDLEGISPLFAACTMATTGDFGSFMSPRPVHAHAPPPPHPPSHLTTLLRL